MRLNLITFNTLGTPFFAPNIAARYKKTAEIIKNNDVDVVCLQEIFSHYNRYLFDRELKSFPYRIYKTFPLGVYGGLAVYSKVPLTFEKFFVYSHPKEVFIPVYTRLAHNGILVSKFKDIPLTLAVTHLTSDNVHDLTPKNRFYTLIKSQLNEAAAEFNKLAEDNNVLLVGDFNTKKDSQLYNEFVKTTDAQDLFAHDNRPTYTPDRVKYPFPTHAHSRIDYMFYKGKHKLKTGNSGLVFADIVEFSKNKKGYLSDHIGLKTTLSF